MIDFKIQKLLKDGFDLFGTDLQGYHAGEDSSGFVELSEFDLFVDKHIPNIRAFGETVH